MLLQFCSLSVGICSCLMWQSVYLCICSRRALKRLLEKLLFSMTGFLSVNTQFTDKDVKPYSENFGLLFSFLVLLRYVRNAAL